MHRYIIFKNGKPWKGFFGELEMMNELDRCYRNLELELEGLEDYIIQIRFFRDVQVCRYYWSDKSYRPCTLLYVKGDEAKNEAGCVVDLEWSELKPAVRWLACLYEDKLAEFLKDKTVEDIKPEYAQTRGAKVMRKIN